MDFVNYETAITELRQRTDRYISLKWFDEICLVFQCLFEALYNRVEIDEKRSSIEGNFTEHYNFVKSSLKKRFIQDYIFDEFQICIREKTREEWLQFYDVSQLYTERIAKYHLTKPT